MRRYFLGLAEKYSIEKRIAKHVFAIGKKKDLTALEQFLSDKYNGKAILSKNGRSGLAIALKANFSKGDKVLVNGFTCFAVFEAVKAAGLVPVFVDISPKDLNFDEKSLEENAKKAEVKGIIIQNTFGNPIEIDKIESLAKKYNLTIIEDLAHCVGAKYSDGREAGTVGTATALSFGKDKVVDTVSGGAVILRSQAMNEIKTPFRKPKTSESLRARFYPLFGAVTRGLTKIHLSGVFMCFMIKVRLIEKSADNRLDLEEKITKFEAKLALEQLKKLKKSGEKPIRDFYFVNDREKVLEKLRKAGYYFDGFWYEKPVSPTRYYKKVRFPETECKNAVFVANHIINFPTYYPKSDLARAREIIKPYLIQEEKE